MKNLDTLSKRILVISVSIAIVALSISALLFSVGHAFASNETDKIDVMTSAYDYSYPNYQAVASQNSIILYDTRSGEVYNYLCPKGYVYRFRSNHDYTDKLRLD